MKLQTQVRLEAGPHGYDWVEGWAKFPDTEAARRGWAHTEVVFNSDGELLTGDTGEPKVLVFEPDGSLSRSFDVPVKEVHGMTLVRRQGLDVLWIADTGMKKLPDRNYKTDLAPNGGQVIAVDLAGMSSPGCRSRR